MRPLSPHRLFGIAATAVAWPEQIQPGVTETRPGVDYPPTRGDLVELLLDAGNETGIVLSWLRKEDDLRGRLDARPVAAQPGLMAVDVAIAAAITVVGVLARSLCRYLEVRERHRGADLELHVTRPGGEKVRVVLTRGEDATALVTRLLGTPAEETDATPRP